MRALDGDLLTLSFYFGDRPEADAFIQLVETLLGLGARFVGTGEAQRGAGVPDHPFADVLEVPIVPVPIRKIADLVRYRADPDIRVIKVYLEGATGTLPEVAEAVGYMGISPQAAQTDRHPLTLYTEGRGLVRAHEQAASDTATRQLGMQLVARFQALVEALHPAYGALLAAPGLVFLPCPTDVRFAQRLHPFRNAFVSRAAVGESGLAQIDGLFPRAYSAPLADGLYVSTMAAFNPAGKSLPGEEAHLLSDAVADLIAGHARSH